MQSRGYGPQSGNSINNFHSVFGGSAGDTGTPPLLDLSEFPSLTNARGNDALPQSNALQPPGSKPYGNHEFVRNINFECIFLCCCTLVGMVKQPMAEQSEFTMSNEDFPALPGTQITDGTLAVNSLGGHDGTDKGPGGAAGVGMDLQTESVSVNDKAFKRGVQTSPDGN